MWRVELNTAGPAQDCKRVLSHPKILQLARQKEVAITFARDAHARRKWGEFREALQLARLRVMRSAPVYAEEMGDGEVLNPKGVPRPAGGLTKFDCSELTTARLKRTKCLEVTPSPLMREGERAGRALNGG